MTTSVNQTENFLQETFGDRPGYVALAFGLGQYRNAEGKYKFREWRDGAAQRFAWPAGRAALIAAVIEVTDRADVFVCPALRATPTRNKGGAVPLARLWADLDAEPADEALWRKLEAWVVASGQPGHRHAYVALSEPVDLATHAVLNKALAARLGADAKWSDESLLRLPGTLNFKPTVPVNGAAPQLPAPVTIEPGWSGRLWSPAEIADLLGVDLSALQDEAVVVETVDGEEIDLDSLPAAIAEALADIDSADRSTPTFTLIMRCRAHGLTQAQAVTIAETYPPAVEKYGPRSGGVAGEVARCWAKPLSQGETEAQWVRSVVGDEEFERKLAEARNAGGTNGVTDPPAPAGETAQGAQSAGAPAAPPTQTRAAGGVRRITIAAASSIKPQRVRWLWEDRLPLPGLSLLGGREGIGKSTCAYQLAADITRGTLAGEFYGTPRAVAIAATEDSWPHTVVPRLMAAGADLDRVFRVDAMTPQDVETGLVLPEDLIGLRAALIGLNAALLLLDPLMSRLAASLDTHKDSEVRQALEPLVKVAQDCDVAVLGIIHVNKSNSTDPLNSLMGSRAFAAVARAVLFCMVDPDDETEERRLLGLPKNNLGRTDVPTRIFRIKNKFVAHTDDGDVWTGALEWLGEVQQSMRSVIEASQLNSEDRTAKSEAMVWLHAYLTGMGGRVDSAVASAEGKKAGHSLAAIKRARSTLKIRPVRRLAFQAGTDWVLPDVAAAASVAGTSRNPAGGGESPDVDKSQSAHARGGRHISELTELTEPTSHTELRTSDSPHTLSSLSSVSAVSANPPRGEPTGAPPATGYAPVQAVRPAPPPRQTPCKHGQTGLCLPCYADTTSLAQKTRKEAK